MSTFKDREDAFERKYQHDEELRFKIDARQARMFGEYVGAALGHDAEQVREYAASMVRANLEEAGTEDMMRKAVADLQAAGQPVDDLGLRHKLEEFFATARQQVMAE